LPQNILILFPIMLCAKFGGNYPCSFREQIANVCRWIALDEGYSICDVYCTIRISQKHFSQIPKWTLHPFKDFFAIWYTHNLNLSFQKKKKKKKGKVAWSYMNTYVCLEGVASLTQSRTASQAQMDVMEQYINMRKSGPRA
jgi:hypothetical protein